MLRLPCKRHKLKPRILFLVPSDYDSLERKGVLHMIYDRDEQGFFERVVTIHPLAFKDHVINLSPVHVIYEFGLRSSLRSYTGLFLLPFRLILFLRKLLRIVKDENIHIIRATDAYLMGLLAWVISRLTGLPFCISIHADYEKRFELNPKHGIQLILRILSKWCPSFVLPRANLVMPIRQSLAEQAISLGAKPASVHVIPHGLKMDIFKELPQVDIRKQFGISEKVKILSFIGRFSKDNYLDDILSMVEKLSIKRSDFILVMMGGGDDEIRLREWFASHKHLSSFIILTGFQPYGTAVSLRQTSYAGICLMGGFSLIEACAAGRPVIAYDVEWHSELVRNGETGFLVKEHDIDGLIKALCFLFDNPPEAEAMGQRARELAFDKHEMEATSRIKRNCYMELLAGSPKFKHAAA